MMRLVSLLALAALAAAPAAASSPPGQAKAKKSYDPDEVICKERVMGGSRLARIRECATRQQWDEHKQQERLGLMRQQYNGAP